jgi:hypothetical protein
MKNSARHCLACATGEFYNNSNFDLSFDLRLWQYEGLK